MSKLLTQYFLELPTAVRWRNRTTIGTITTATFHIPSHSQQTCSSVTSARRVTKAENGTVIDEASIACVILMTRFPDMSSGNNNESGRAELVLGMESHKRERKTYKL